MTIPNFNDAVYMLDFIEQATREHDLSGGQSCIITQKFINIIKSLDKEDQLAISFAVNNYLKVQ